MPKSKSKADSSTQVNQILQSLKQKKPPASVASVEPEDEKEVLPEVPRGRPKSGKIWKDVKQRFNTIKKTKGVHESFAKKQALRETLKSVKETSRALQEEKKARTEELKERRRINIKKTEENRLKAEVVQVITNSAKVKRMKKKQLRFIQKRDTSQITK